MTNENKKTAVLYRMVMPGHICPYGLKSLDLLQRKGFEVEDRHLTTREETDAFKAEHDVKTTPQTFIDGERIGGYDSLRDHFGLDRVKPGETTYRPIIAIFSMTFLMAAALGWLLPEPVIGVRLIEHFIAISMCVLAVQKLQDLASFSGQFLGYDLLARKWVPYAYIYPFAEGWAGILMLAGVATFIAAPVALVIGTIGAVSVYKAVYVDKRELKCACVGGNSNVPLGFVSLTENIMMMAMAIWMMVKPLL
ncbi:glutaredoxin [Ponticaulis sp.]|uniref:glutaredoxin n=1 Tax=Ponticaulis sp. TaxID=2020902 RepID=UPI000C58C42E|nr:glutaredoxin [Ponticaulis sp.]MBN05224.1 glutaredoxin [Ponticaulis sp.]